MADLTHNSHTVRGYCALCTAHCATIATVTDGKVVRLEADSDHPNGGYSAITLDSLARVLMQCSEGAAGG